jgi:hypothetical protein
VTDYFPSVRPTGRSYLLPTRPATAALFLAGGRVSFSHDPIGINTPIPLEFEDLKSSEKDLIIAHYRTFKQHKPFQIPSSVWLTHDALNDLIPYYTFGKPTYFTYDQPVTFEITSGGLFRVTVVLRARF